MKNALNCYPKQKVIMLALKLVSLVLSFLITHEVYGLPSDKEKPVLVEADYAEIDHKNGVGTYKNHVKIQQGTSHVTADEVFTYFDKDDQLVEAIAKGTKSNLAHFWTLPHTDKPELHAYALTIKFYPQKNHVVLLGQARIKQGQETYNAPHIEYDLTNNRVISPPHKEGKTVIILENRNKLSPS